MVICIWVLEMILVMVFYCLVVMVVILLLNSSELSSTAFSIDTNGNERFRINSVGNVGIGTNAPGMKVHVESGTPYIRSKNTAAPSDEKSWDFNAGTDGILRFRNTNDAANSSNNWLEVERDGVSTHSIRLLTGIGTERVRIDSNGKFGLGTNNPQALLDVEQTTQGEVARFRASNSTRYLKISSFDSGFNGSGFDFNATSNTGEISFSTEDVEKVRIDNDGNFGIGTNNPSHKLDVVGNTQLYGTLVIGDNTDISPTANGAGQLHIDANGYTPYIAADGTAMYVGHNSTSRDLRLQTNETDRLTIDGSTGNIGINTDAPTAKLNVVTTSTDDVILMLEADMGTNNNRTLQFKSPATDSAADPFLIQTGNSIQFRIDSTNALKINDNSNVGIGEESPDVRLHVKEQFDIAYSLANVADEANHLLKLENPSTTANAFSGMQFRVGSGADMFFGAIQQSVNHGDFFFANQNSPQREMMRIKSTGQVGVNQTTWSNKNHMFEVKQSTNDKEIARFTAEGGSGSVQGKGYVGLSVFNATTYPHAWIGVEEDNNGSYLGHLTFSTRSVSFRFCSRRKTSHNCRR